MSKTKLPESLKGGVIMDVVERRAGRHRRRGGRGRPSWRSSACPSDIRAAGRRRPHVRPEHDQARSWQAVTIPVMAKCRIGHFVEAQILEALGVDCIDESRGADARRRGVPRRQAPVQGAVRLRRPRPRRGAAPHRRRRGDDPHEGRGRAPATSSRRCATCARSCAASAALTDAREDELMVAGEGAGRAVRTGASRCASTAACRSSNFSAGGIATPADAALMMQLGADGVFVGSGIFKSEDPAKRAKAIVEATNALQRPGEARRAEPQLAGRHARPRDGDAWRRRPDGRPERVTPLAFLPSPCYHHVQY